MTFFRADLVSSLRALPQRLASRLGAKPSETAPGFHQHGPDTFELTGGEPGTRSLLFGGREIPEEPASFQKAYLPPNEFNAHLFEAEIPSDSVVISVGTLRAFNDALRVPNGRVIIVDACQPTVAFNERFGEAILASRDRHELLSWLQGTAAPASLPRAAIRLQAAIDPRGWAGKPELRYMEAALNRLADSPLWKEHFLGDDQAFETVRQMVRQRRIVSVVASLAGTRTLPALASALRARGEKIGAVNVSNVPDYVWGDAQRQLHRNLKLLPTTDNPSLFVTAAVGRGPATPDQFEYYVFPLRDFQEFDNRRKHVEGGVKGFGPEFRRGLS